MSRFFHRFAAALAVLLLMAVSGLAFAAGTAESEAAAEEPSNSLRVYTYDAFPEALETAIVNHFASRYDVTVELQRMQDTGDLYNQTFLGRENPEADVIIGLDNTYVGRAIEADLFQPYRPASADMLREEVVLDPEFRLTPFDWGNIVLNYDSEELPNPPQSWEELLDPSLRESIIVMNPATSSPGRNFLLLTIEVFGEDGYLEFWEQLKPNILTVTSGWSEGYGLYTQGEAPIVVSYETSPAYHIAYENTDRYKNLILGDLGYAQVEVAGITKGARNVENARRLIDYLLEAQLQEIIPLNQFMYPVNPEVVLPPAFEQVEKAGRTVTIPVDRVDANFDAWLEAWEEVMR
ncbi:MAG: thiamine ABC transporter substrate binding subunit [Spirochaetales bacterium]